MQKVLIALWSTIGRDFQMIMPIVYYFEKIKHYDIRIISIWDWYVVDHFKPDVILFANTIGGRINFRFLKYLKSKGYRVVSLVSEGNYTIDNIKQFVWGWNNDMILYEDMNFLWSQRCLDMVLKYFPELEPKLTVSGAVGFDRYKIYNFMGKNDFLEKYHLSKYNKIIGYACWAFDIIKTDDEIEKIKNKGLKDRIQSFQDRLCADNYAKYLTIKSNVNKILKDTIENKPDILFILKLHPGTLDDENTEIKDLNYPNVLILKNEEEIADIINVCDIWMGFNSTTALEAWLLNKPTINIYPPNFEEDRVINLQGSISLYNSEDLHNYIDEYYSNEFIQDFEEKRPNRETIIEQIIQWDDGLNHIRVGEKIAKMIENSEKSNILKDNPLTRIRLYLIHLLIKYSKYLKRTGLFNDKNYISYQVSEEDIQKFRYSYYPDLDKFHGEISKKYIE